jgi:hypothetical protein
MPSERFIAWGMVVLAILLALGGIAFYVIVVAVGIFSAVALGLTQALAVLTARITLLAVLLAPLEKAIDLLVQILRLLFKPD